MSLLWVDAGRVGGCARGCAVTSVVPGSARDPFPFFFSSHVSSEAPPGYSRGGGERVYVLTEIYRGCAGLD